MPRYRYLGTHLGTRLGTHLETVIAELKTDILPTVRYRQLWPEYDGSKTVKAGTYLLIFYLRYGTGPWYKAVVLSLNGPMVRYGPVQCTVRYGTGTYLGTGTVPL